MFKLLPVTIVLAAIVLASKGISLYEGSKFLMAELVIKESIAADKKEEDKKQPESEKSDSENKEADGAKTAAECPAPAPVDLADKPQFSESEIELLQSLSKRRGEIEQKEKDIALKADVLKATEKKIEEKIDELNKLKTEVDSLLAQYNEKEEAKIRSLVKIYESMKAKDAARIFEELEINVLLQVIDKMKEVKIAPILANVSAERAKEITMKLAKQKRLPESVDSANPSSLPSSPASLPEDN